MRSEEFQDGGLGCGILWRQLSMGILHTSEAWSFHQSKLHHHIEKPHLGAIIGGLTRGQILQFTQRSGHPIVCKKLHASPHCSSVVPKPQASNHLSFSPSLLLKISLRTGALTWGSGFGESCPHDFHAQVYMYTRTYIYVHLLQPYSSSNRYAHRDRFGECVCVYMHATTSI